MCDYEGFYAHSPEKPRSPLKEMSDEQLVEKAIDKSVEVARYNRAEHERTSHPDYDPYNDPEGPSADILVSESDGRLQLRELRRMPIARVFGCRSCYEEVPASEKLPAIAIVTMEHWTRYHWDVKTRFGARCTSTVQSAKSPPRASTAQTRGGTPSTRVCQDKRGGIRQYLNVNVVTQGPGPHTPRLLGVEVVVLVVGRREAHRVAHRTLG